MWYFWPELGFDIVKGLVAGAASMALQVVAPMMVEQWLPPYNRALAGESVSMEQRITTEDNEYFFDVTFNPIVSDDTVTGVAVFSRDVSARVVAGRALRES